MTQQPKTTFEDHRAWSNSLDRDDCFREQYVTADNCDLIWEVAPHCKPYAAGPRNEGEMRQRRYPT
jgi:hypothetical protein